MQIPNTAVKSSKLENRAEL